MCRLKRKIATLILTLAIASSTNAGQPDTTIIKKAVNNMVYISPNKTAWQYDSLRSFSLVPAKNSTTSFPYGKWVELSQYNNKYYLYYPCDVGNLHKLEITKTTVREYGVETEDYSVKAVRKRNTSSYIFDIVDERGSLKSIGIYWVDKSKGIAIRENVGSSEDSRYQLLLVADKVKSYPLIINDCDVKADELTLQKINYKRLLQRKGSK